MYSGPAVPPHTRTEHKHGGGLGAQLCDGRVHRGGRGRLGGRGRRLGGRLQREGRGGGVLEANDPGRRTAGPRALPAERPQIQCEAAHGPPTDPRTGPYSGPAARGPRRGAPGPIRLGLYFPPASRPRGCRPPVRFRLRQGQGCRTYRLPLRGRVLFGGGGTPFPLNGVQLGARGGRRQPARAALNVRPCPPSAQIV